MREKIKRALEATKKAADRDVKMFLVMVFLSLIGVAIALPFIWAMTFLPDWSLVVLMCAAAVWVVFGDTISAAVKAYRGDKR